MQKEEEPRIVVIAQDLHLKATLESLLNSLGYLLEVYGEFPTAEEFQQQAFAPEVLLIEVQPETFDEAEVIAKQANINRKTPVIYIAGNKEEGFFNKIKETKPFGFILKPVDLGEIKRVVELAVAYEANSYSSTYSGDQTPISASGLNIFKPFFFTKVGNKLRRIDPEDVLYIEVEGKYSSIQLAERKFHVKASLKEMLEKFPTNHFLRVSRNFIINLERIDHIDTSQFIVKIESREIPISRTYKDDLMNRIQLL